MYVTLKSYLIEICIVNFITLISLQLLFFFSKYLKTDCIKREERVRYLYLFASALEVFIAFSFFIGGPERTKVEPKYIGAGMSFINLVIVLLKAAFATTEYKIFVLQKNILNKCCTTLSGEEIPAPYFTCGVCHDNVTDEGIVTKCLHKFHFFCFREWIREVGPECPDCRKMFIYNCEYESCVEENCCKIKEKWGFVEVIYDEKTLEENLKLMKKFDSSLSYFSNIVDLHKDYYNKFNIHVDVTEVNPKYNEVEDIILSETVAIQREYKQKTEQKQAENRTIQAENRTIQAENRIPTLAEILSQTKLYASASENECTTTNKSSNHEEIEKPARNEKENIEIPVGNEKEKIERPSRNKKLSKLKAQMESSRKLSVGPTSRNLHRHKQCFTPNRTEKPSSTQSMTSQVVRRTEELSEQSDADSNSLSGTETTVMKSGVVINEYTSEAFIPESINLSNAPY